MKKESGFSLIELLVVIAILVVLLVASLPAVNSTIRGLHITSAGQGVVDQLNNARQQALARNLPVEVRFYKLPDYDAAAGATPAVYRALQCFLLDDTNSVPLAKPTYFASPVVFSSKSAESSMFDNGLFPEVTTPTDRVPVYGVNYAYRSFVFKPSGGTTLPNSATFVTLVMENDKLLSQGANFLTVQIDPVTGRAQTFRP